VLPLDATNVAISFLFCFFFLFFLTPDELAGGCDVVIHSAQRRRRGVATPRDPLAELNPPHEWGGWGGLIKGGG